MKCNRCRHELAGNESFCPECGSQLKVHSDRQRGFGDYNAQVLEELRKINKQLEEGNRQRTQLANSSGQLISNGAILNYLK